MEAFGLEVEEELSTVATQTWAEGVWIGKWLAEQKEAWLNQVVETSERTCRSGDVRDPCFGHQVGTLTLWFLQGKKQVNMRYVRPKDVKKMLSKQARTTFWKK